MRDAHTWITRLGLQPHPEGGWFRETYRSAERIAHASLPPRFTGDRAFATMIYYLLDGGTFSAFHRIQQDEGWHFYDGSSLTLHVLAPDGTHATHRLGLDHEPQAVVPAGHYFAAVVDDPASYTLAGCTVAPGFDFTDFEMPSRGELLHRFPQHRALLERLTR